MDSIALFNELLPDLKNKIIICDDISSGVVPMGSEMRKWREVVGRVLALLSKNADEVVRVFCGIGSRIA
jgi:adenosyl cobinamide kinase/adenosyl cobinamide phosphate guanylyltransferase